MSQKEIRVEEKVSAVSPLPDPVKTGHPAVKAIVAMAEVSASENFDALLHLLMREPLEHEIVLFSEYFCTVMRERYLKGNVSSKESSR